MPAFIDLTGQHFERLLVVERAENDKHGGACWRCLCDCGSETVVSSSNLRSGHTKSCGCFQRETMLANDRAGLHGHTGVARRARQYRERHWEKRLIKVYGLKEGEYAQVLERQGGVCALCGKKPGRVRLAVDHDHQTNRVRGLVHSRCNRGLAPFEHSVEALVRLIVYAGEILEDRNVRVLEGSRNG